MMTQSISLGCKRPPRCVRRLSSPGMHRARGPSLIQAACQGERAGVGFRSSRLASARGKNAAMSIYDQDLDKNPANYVALSPVSFVERSAEVFADLPAVVHGRRRYLWRDTRERAARLAAALRALGVARGTTVSLMLPNIPEMIEAHYAVPALNAVLHPLNTRLRSEEHTSELQSRSDLVCRLLLEKKKKDVIITLSRAASTYVIYRLTGG